MNLKLRPPIVSILGHVDHGKTTLLDSIRNTRIAAKEAGGITQGIGASWVITADNKKITFIDTPGHAAFDAMRSRGVSISDIVILVVAANEGVKPQTKEVIDYLKKVKVPCIVAATKIDLSTSSLELVRKSLNKEEIVFEDEGGNTPIVPVSAKTGEGIGKLLELIVLLSEIHEIKGDESADLEGYVVETNKDSKGLFATVVVKNGSINIGDRIVAGEALANIKGIFDFEGRKIIKLMPGDAGTIFGFDKIPESGSRLVTYSKTANSTDKLENLKQSANGLSTDISTDKIPLIIKARTLGSLEVVIKSIPEKYTIIEGNIGDVNDSDIFLAKTNNKSTIIVFESKVPQSVSKLAESEGIRIERFDVIYKLVEFLQNLITQKEDTAKGEAHIIAVFPFNKKRVAGCKIIKGVIEKSDNLLLKRGEDVLGTVRIISIKKGKTDVPRAKEGEELGIIFVPQLDFEPSDVLISQRK